VIDATSLAGTAYGTVLSWDVNDTENGFLIVRIIYANDCRLSGTGHYPGVCPAISLTPNSGTKTRTVPYNSHNSRWENRVMSAAKDLFLVGLRNAYAMESQAREMLERQAGRLENIPKSRK
jgi:hypothetical protein